MRVKHIPNSGWPGRPRNLGIEMARGDYVLFVDNDDWLAEDALERLYATAVADGADIVVGKVVAHGSRSVPRGLFRENRHGIRFDGDELLALLTPHKLFRREFLEDHAIRFPEGKRRLEDHPFVVEAYFRARRVSVLADGPVYHWAMRDSDVNASARPFEPEGYFDNVREVLDLVTRRTPEGPLRDALLLHWYRGKMLGRVGGRGFLRRDPQYRRDLYEAVRSLQAERFGPQSDAALPLHLRARAHLLRAGEFASLEALAAFEEDLSPKIELRKVQGDGTHLLARARARLGTQALRFAPPGERATWIPPEELREPLAGADLTVDLRDCLAADLAARRGDRGRVPRARAHRGEDRGRRRGGRRAAAGARRGERRPEHRRGGCAAARGPLGAARGHHGRRLLQRAAIARGGRAAGARLGAAGRDPPRRGGSAAQAQAAAAAEPAGARRADVQTGKSRRSRPALTPSRSRRTAARSGSIPASRCVPLPRASRSFAQNGAASTRSGSATPSALEHVDRHVLRVRGDDRRRDLVVALAQHPALRVEPEHQQQTGRLRADADADEVGPVALRGSPAACRRRPSSCGCGGRARRSRAGRGGCRRTRSRRSSARASRRS